MNSHLDAIEQTSSGLSGIKLEPEPDFLFIGELAQETGSNPKTIRFYEREGLITPARHGRFRVYSRENERQLQSVLKMRAMGIPLARIREVLYSVGIGEDPLMTPQFAALLKTHLDELERRHGFILAEIAAAQEALLKAEMRKAS
jgi:DNA-binding transcriptional MerR regulator